MKTCSLLGLFLILAACPLSAFAFDIYTYDVNWPAIYLEGTFTLDVGSGFGNYFSSQALGTYQGVTLFPQQVWTSVEFSAQPNFAELYFIWNQGYTGYAVSPSYVGKSSPWTTADEAWQDLLTKSAADGVHITIVPEPREATFLYAVLLLAATFRRRNVPNTCRESTPTAP